MKTARRITRNFLSLTASEILAKILQLAIFIFLARTFGPFEFGKFGFALAFSTITVIVTDFGINTLLIREISRNKNKVKKYVSNALVIKIFLSIITFFVASIYLNFGGYTGDIMTITYIMVAFMVIQSFTDLFYSVFRAFEKMHYDAIIKVLRMVILSTLIFIVLIKNPDLILATLMFPITEIIIAIIALIMYTRFFEKISVRFNLRFSKELIKKSSFFCLSLIFASLLLYIDTVMLQKMKGSAEVGIYSAAYNILLGLTFIPVMYSNAVFPVFSRYFIKDKSLLKFAYKKSFKYMIILGFPIATGIYVYSRNITLLIYGPGYSESIIALKILCWFVALRFITALSGTVLSSINRQDSRVKSQGLLAIINIILNLILIPKFGFVGAGIATVISEVLIVFFYYYFIAKYKLGFKAISTSIRPLIATIIMAFIIINIPNLLLGTIVGAISYMGALLILKTFKKEDKVLLMRVIKNY